MNYDRLSQKKKQLDAYRPLPDALLRNLDDWFRVELTYTSNAIEGNTLTRNETALVVEKGITVGGKTLVEHLEATNHAAALDWVRARVADGLTAISQKDIIHIQDIILKGIDDNNAGHYRSVAVRIAGSRVILPNPVKVPTLMSQFVDFLKNSKQLHPVELAARAHYELVTIHPFVDGNGRTARLLMNIILLMSGYPMAIIRKQDRLAYIKSLEQAQLGGSLDDYLKLISKAVDRSLDIYLKAISGDDAVMQDDEALLKIGMLAKKVDESVSTIRHWTSEGLLEVAETMASGYQLYSADMVKRARLIQKLKRERYTLKEIKRKL